MILPAAIRYQGELAQTAASVKAAGLTPDTEILQKVSTLATQLKEAITSLEKKLAHHNGGTLRDEAKQYCTDLCPAMLAVRTVADELEGIVADDLWPLPTYQEMLFIK
jgi:glutamine synthetase